jgi:hypothetical protein
MSIRSLAGAATLAAALLLGAGLPPAAATHLGYCGASYTSAEKYWETKHPDVATVLSHLPPSKRKTSGNMLSLDYARDSSGNMVNKTDFDLHWRSIFGTSTTSGYGHKLAGSWAPSANTSWGVATTDTRRNLSECVVDGTAICLGIPSGRINVSSLGHHTTFAILDSATMGSVGSKACIVYEAMFSSNFDFKGIPGKLPGLSNAPLGSASPNDHLCYGRERVKNTGATFSTRIQFSDSGAPSTAATAKLGNNFKNDMFSYDCAADGNATASEFMTAMHSQDPKGMIQSIQRGVWYRFEHELVLNTNYSTSRNALSGASSRIWVYRKSDGVLLQSFGSKDSFQFDADQDGSRETYPLMPRNSSEKRINGIFMSIQQGGNLSGSGPWVLDYAIAMRNFALFLK